MFSTPASKTPTVSYIGKLNAIRMRVESQRRRVDAAFDAIPAHMKEIATVAHNYARQETRGSLHLRYMFGCKLSDGMVSTRDIQLIATYLGVAPKELCDTIEFVRAFTLVEVNAIADRIMSNGGRISYGHLVLIARAHPECRAELIEDVFAESLSVRQLAQLVRVREATRPTAIDGVDIAGQLDVVVGLSSTDRGNGARGQSSDVALPGTRKVKGSRRPKTPKVMKTLKRRSKVVGTAFAR